MAVVDARGPEPGRSPEGGSAQDEEQDPSGRAELPRGVLAAATGDPGMPLPGAPAVEPPLADLGSGRGPSWLDDWIGANVDRVRAWRRHLHANPELSRGEHKTTTFLVDELTRLGLSPQVLPGGTGLICDIEGDDSEPGPTVALRADIDALPLAESSGLPYASTVDGAAHACGHDAHTAIMLGTALALAQAPRLPGRVRMIFQPAEEVMPGGALDVLAAGGLDGVDRIFGLHCDPRLPVGQVGTRVGAITSAADLLEVRLSSPGGHTSRPHLTADLVHALGTLITDLPTLLSRRVDPRTGTVLTWGAVHSGEAPNAIPQNGVLTGTLRTADRDTWATMERLTDELVGSLLAPLGVGYDLHHLRGVPPVVNEATSTDLLSTAVVRAAGEDALTGTAQSSGGEDFGWYLEHVPGSFARLGVHSGDGPVQDLHQPAFWLDERALVVGIRTMVHAAGLSLRR
ncbi:M20 family metallopeptidase [Saccharopolyspora montiporae]|uniref:M20 family metallopeptidase n=1 Tax=Saccharopolyspora montiporae TaxID=2781240 RepID=UPI00351C3279